MIRFIAIAFLSFSSSLLATQSQPANIDTDARNYIVDTISVVRSKPEGKITGIWDRKARFTSNERQGDWVRITGRISNGQWQAVERETWISKFYVSQQPAPNRLATRSNRPDGITRYIKVSKSDFSLQVMERRNNQVKTIYTTKVALGMDRCLPENKGGRCYYTRPGTYQVKRKYANADGIQWCIPKNMEVEYPYEINAENRCFRGPFGKHALNIGGSYAIHGTDRPDLLGKKVSHGCVRASNQDMAKIYNLMEVGDKVLIVN